MSTSSNRVVILQKANELHAQGMTWTDVAKKMGIARSLLARYRDAANMPIRRRFSDAEIVTTAGRIREYIAKTGAPSTTAAKKFGINYQTWLRWNSITLKRIEARHGQPITGNGSGHPKPLPLLPRIENIEKTLMSMEAVVRKVSNVVLGL